MPKRIQRQRTKDWRMLIQIAHVQIVRPDGADAGDVVWAYKHALCWDLLPGEIFLSHVAELRGRDLACWCPLSAPCHADVLLELANQEAHSGA